MSILKSKRKEYEKISKEYENKSMVENKFYLLSSSYFKNILNNKSLDDKTLEFFYDLCKEWDDYGSLDLNFGLELENLIEDKDYVIGVHRTDSYSYIDNDGEIHSKLISTIFDEGLKNFGDLSSGVDITEAPEPAKTVSPITDIMDAVIYLKSSYKNSDASVLVALPRDYVDNYLEFKGDYQNEIYNIKGKSYTIKPEYLVGVVYQKGGNCKVYTKEEVKSQNKGKVEVI